MQHTLKRKKSPHLLEGRRKRPRKRPTEPMPPKTRKKNLDPSTNPRPQGKEPIHPHAWILTIGKCSLTPQHFKVEASAAFLQFAVVGPHEERHFRRMEDGSIHR